MTEEVMDISWLIGRSPDQLRALEIKVDAMVAEMDMPEDNEFLVKVRRLISDQIVGLETRRGFLIAAPDGRVFEVA